MPYFGTMPFAAPGLGILSRLLVLVLVLGQASLNYRASQARAIGERYGNDRGDGLNSEAPAPDLLQGLIRSLWQARVIALPGIEGALPSGASTAAPPANRLSLGQPSNDTGRPMGQRFNELSEKHIQFIAKQKIFFVGTATADSRVNISPKGMDSFRVLGNSRVAWLNVTGSGNETAAHVQQDPRMTVMFCAFEGRPLILRLYGSAKAVHMNDPEWNDLFPLFKPLPGARQIFDVTLDLVQASCGMAVPYFSYARDRELLSDWAEKKGDEGLRQYWEKNNQVSIDGIPIHIVTKNG